MALGDVLIYDDGVFGVPGSKRFRVNTGGPAAIQPGELVLKVQGAQATAGQAGKGSFVTDWGTSLATKPSVGTDFLAGLAASASTETLTATGVVDVIPNLPGMTYLITPNSTTAFNTQTKYNLLVGARVLLNTSSTGVQTILATDNTHNAAGIVGGGGIGSGLIVEPLDISVYPGKVRFSISQGCNYFI